eukprot:6368859-Lingulodinium_polyedra.AAC.1
MGPPGTPLTSARCRLTRVSAPTATNAGGERATSATSGPTGLGTWASTASSPRPETNRHRGDATMSLSKGASFAPAS